MRCRDGSAALTSKISPATRIHAPLHIITASLVPDLCLEDGLDLNSSIRPGPIKRGLHLRTQLQALHCRQPPRASGITIVSHSRCVSMQSKINLVKLDLTLGAHAFLEVSCGGFGTNLLLVSSVTVASWLPPNRALAEHVKVSLLPDAKDIFSTEHAARKHPKETSSSLLPGRPLSPTTLASGTIFTAVRSIRCLPEKRCSTISPF